MTSTAHAVRFALIRNSVVVVQRAGGDRDLFKGIVNVLATHT